MHEYCGASRIEKLHPKKQAPHELNFNHFIYQNLMKKELVLTFLMYLSVLFLLFFDLFKLFNQHTNSVF